MSVRSSRETVARFPRSPRLILTALRGVFAQLDSANMGLVAAGVAFFSMLAIFPGLAALIALYGLISDPHVLLEQMALLQDIVPPDVYNLIAKQVETLITTSGDTLGWTGAVSTALAIWSARAGVAAMMRGLNAIHGSPNRGSLRHYFTALMLTVALMGVSMSAMLLVVIAPLVLQFLYIGPFVSLLVDAVRWMAAIGVLLVGLALLYRYGPNTRANRMHWATPGGVLAVLLWALVSWGFSKYLQNFGNYNEVYGSIGAVVALLMWLYLSTFLVLLGASLNVHLKSVQTTEAVRKAEQEAEAAAEAAEAAATAEASGPAA
ncbi:YihY/virulence factor BrkB family protein [Pseudooceanicola nanhaiensis]|uniref:YihY/virulence factor BrkB family protein n=1 Tax=Pseudooceanicola nanhaiensis TaxID=375761 RepID=UPI001CD5A01E|nr:YihY/virulence factor BrkB family protein [Pseudooceanicola nanhaiensis]MCA0919021.1 YihY/virulence factor BrkB family protein [Pseudooceanicola nanhaiensis]